MSKTYDAVFALAQAYLAHVTHDRDCLVGFCTVGGDMATMEAIDRDAYEELQAKIDLIQEVIERAGKDFTWAVPKAPDRTDCGHGLPLERIGVAALDHRRARHCPARPAATGGDRAMRLTDTEVLTIATEAAESAGAAPNKARRHAIQALHDHAGRLAAETKDSLPARAAAYRREMSRYAKMLEEP